MLHSYCRSSGGELRIAYITHRAVTLMNKIQSNLKPNRFFVTQLIFYQKLNSKIAIIISIIYL